jgi:hypothetical protein
MNPLYQAVVKLQQRLSSAGIESAVIGGIAVSMWARPRATEDADFKVLLDRDNAQDLLNVLQPITPNAGQSCRSAAAWRRNVKTVPAYASIFS